MTITPALGIAVMMNNFFHDLSVAMFACALGALYLIARERAAASGGAHAASLERLSAACERAARWSFVFILLFGAVRAAAFERFEWLPMAERGQIAALIVKHILFVVLIAWGLLQLRAQRRAARSLPER